MHQRIILAAIDPRHQPSAVLFAAFNLATEGTRLHVMMVNARSARAQESQQRESLDAIVRLGLYLHAAAHPGWRPPPLIEELAEGPAADVIVQRARDLDAWQLVLARGPRGPLRSLFGGSIDELVGARVSCPVVVVPIGTVAWATSEDGGSDLVVNALTPRVAAPGAGGPHRS